MRKKYLSILLSVSVAFTSVNVYGMELSGNERNVKPLIVEVENEESAINDLFDENKASFEDGYEKNTSIHKDDKTDNIDSSSAKESISDVPEIEENQVTELSAESDEAIVEADVEGYRSGSGTENDPYIISDLEEFIYFGKDTSKSKDKYYKLTSDIYFNTSLDAPINDYTNQSGSGYNFDGGNRTIYNFYSSNGSSVCRGANEVAYLTVNNAKISNGSCVIGGSNVYMCKIMGDLYANPGAYNTSFSGISNRVETAYYCKYEAKLINEESISPSFTFSGIANSVTESIAGCINGGTVRLDSGVVCGIAYNVSGQMSDCSTTDSCELYSETGTVCGMTYYMAGSINDCTNNANLNGSIVCGLIYELKGSNFGTSAKNLINKGNLKSHIKSVNSKYECYGIINRISTYYYDRMACYSKINIENCINEGLIDVSVDGNCDAVAGGLFGVISAEKNPVTIKLCVNSGTIQSVKGNGGGSLCGLAVEIYITNDCEDGILIEECSNTGNIISNHAVFCSGLIGNMGTMSRKNSDNTIVVMNCANCGDITSVSDASGIVSHMYYGTVEKCTNTGVISSDTLASGIVGNTSRSTMKYGNLPEIDADVINIIKCVNSGELTGRESESRSSYAGGIVGSMQFGSIESCYNSGSIIMKGNSGHTGGICGTLYIGTSDSYGNVNVKNSFNAGKIDAGNSTNKYIGGLFGWLSVSNEDITVTITNVYNVGTVLASQTYYNGPSEYVGAISSSVSNSAGRIVMSGLYYLEGIQPWYSYYKGVSPISAKALSKKQLQQKESLVGFDFDNDWYFNSMSSEYLYPMLKDVEYLGLTSASNDVKKNKWGDIEWKLSDGTLWISGDGRIPTLNYDENAPWYKDKDSIKDIIVDDGVTGIGTRWFYKLDKVEFISIASTVSYIGDRAFENCTGLDEVILPDGVNAIGSRAFANCSRIKELTLPEGVKKINTGLFSNCKNLEKVYVPSTIEYMYSDAFKGCENLHTIVYSATKYEWDRIEKTTKDGFNKLIDDNGVFIQYADGTIAGRYKYVTFADGGNTVASYDFNFDKSWFEKNSYEYNHELARASLKVAMAGIGKIGDEGAKGKIYENEATNNIRQLMEGMGFEYNYHEENVSEAYESIIYPKSLTREDYDNIGTAIGSRTIINNGKEDTLVLVVVRGGGYLAEWGGNLKVGSNLYGFNHKGFEYAADTVIDRLDEYLDYNSHKIKGDVNLWIAGYSRSAAVANIVGAKIDDGMLQNINVSRNNVFEYGFECPQNTINMNAHNAKYNNLFSIINPDDLVPKVAPASQPFWNFTRYGVTYSIPVSIGSKDKSAFIARNEKYIDILGYLGKDTLKTYNEKNPNKWYGLNLIFDDLINMVADLVVSRDSYAVNFQTTMMDVAAKHMPQNKEVEAGIDGMYGGGFVIYSVIWEIFRVVYGEVVGDKLFDRAIANLCEGVVNVGVNWLVLNNNPKMIFSLIGPAHYPELCLAWMESLDEDELKKEKGLRIIYINCPVDVNVKDEDGNIVGQIIDDKPVAIEDGVFTYFDSNNQKVIVLPMDAEYDLQFEATDDGEMTYTVVERIDTEYIPRKIVSFEDVNIVNGEKLHSNIEECIESEADYELIHESGLSESADISLKDSEVFFCNVSVETVGPGIALNAGSFVPGSYCTLKAESVRNVDGDFIGWFEADADETVAPISTEREYRFPVKTDVNLVAKFKDITGQMWVADIDSRECYYTGSPIKPTIKVYDGETLLKEKVDYTVSYKNNIKAYTLDESDEGFNPKKAPIITVTGKGNYTDKEIIYYKIYPKKITDENVTVGEYNIVLSNGKIQKPVPNIFVDKKKLSAKKDYSVEFYSSYNALSGELSGQIDSAEGPKNPGTYYALIKGIGNYSDSVVRELIIENGNTKKLISKLKLSKIKAKPYQNGEDVVLTEDELKSLIVDGREKLVYGEDYTISYSDNITDVGKVKVTITGTGIKYVGTATISYNITGIPFNKVKIAGFVSKFDYCGGNEINQSATLSYKKSSKSPTIEMKGISLEEYEGLEDSSVKRSYDYTYEYINNVYPGTATVKYSGINNYYGAVSKKYKIVGLAFNKVKINNFASTMEYTGEEIEQSGAVLTYISSDGEKHTLNSGKDYSVEYKSNINVGKAIVTYTGMGAYKGKINKTFKILPYDINLDTRSNTIIYYDDICPYSKNGAKSKITVEYEGETLEYKKDYTISYSNNKKLYAYNPEDALFISRTAPTIKVTGKGNYKGTCLIYYKIDRADISDASFRIMLQDVVYKDKVNNVKSTPIILDADGKKLVIGKDFDNEIEYYYEYIPEERYVIDGRDSSRSNLLRKKGDLVQDYDIAPIGTIIRVRTCGIGNYTGERDGVTPEDNGYDTYRIIEQSIASASAQVKAKTYTGKEIYLSDEDITLTIGSKKDKRLLREGVDYIILNDSYKNNVKKGKATVIIKGINGLGGTKNIVFTIGAKGFLWWWRNLFQ